MHFSSLLSLSALQYLQHSPIHSYTDVEAAMQVLIRSKITRWPTLPAELQPAQITDNTHFLHSPIYYLFRDNIAVNTDIKTSWLLPSDRAKLIVSDLFLVNYKLTSC